MEKAGGNEETAEAQSSPECRNSTDKSVTPLTTGYKHDVSRKWTIPLRPMGKQEK